MLKRILIGTGVALVALAAIAVKVALSSDEAAVEESTAEETTAAEPTAAE